MTTSIRKITANRRNATQSTGPRSVSGKFSVSRNAVKHGLSASMINEPGHLTDIETLAKMLVGRVSDPRCLDLARDAAGAELELLRVRKLRTAALKLGLVPQDLASGSIENAQDAAITASLRSVAKLERYERRALSRRKKLFRQLTMLIDGGPSGGFVLPNGLGCCVQGDTADH